MVPAAGVVDRTHKGEAAPTAAFKDMAGKSHSLVQFKGKPVLLNLGATWCAPCVAEMPALDTLAGETPGVQLVAVSQDFEGAAKITPFWAKAGIRNFQSYLDTETALSTGMAVNLPTTILYDATGHELWRASGGMDWASDKAKALIAEAR